MDYFLKANTETILWNKLVEVGAAKQISVKNEAGEVIETRHIATDGYAIDVIGVIYKPTGNFIQQTVDERVAEIPEVEALEGFHANLRGPADLAPKVEYIEYKPSNEELANTEFVMPAPEQKITPSPLEELLVYPKNPVRVWA